MVVTLESFDEDEREWRKWKLNPAIKTQAVVEHHGGQPSIWREMAPLFVASLALAVLGVGAWVGRSWQESRAFERVTGQQVSLYEAMFLELRVEGRPAAESQQTTAQPAGQE